MSFRRLAANMRNFIAILEKIRNEMLNSPDTLEQGFWAILALFWGITFFYVDLNGLLTVTIMFSLLIVATVSWSYYMRVRRTS